MHVVISARAQAQSALMGQISPTHAIGHADKHRRMLVSKRGVEQAGSKTNGQSAYVHIRARTCTHEGASSRARAA
eukprot:6173004-Pleurochrysis_carterae.AAC.1